MNSSRTVLTILGIIVAVVLGTIGGYSTGYSEGHSVGLSQGEENNAVKIPESGLLVEEIYSGGDLVDPENAKERILIFDNGEVYKITRGGHISLVNTVYSGDIKFLKDDIAEENFDDAFVKKERSFCISAVDGVDKEIILYLPNGDAAAYSDCDYTFNHNHPLIERIDHFTSI